MLELSDEGLIVFDGAGCCRMIGRRAGEIFGVEPAAFVGKPRTVVLEACANACADPVEFLRAANPGVRESGVAGAGIGMDVSVVMPEPRTVLCRGMNVVQDGRTFGLAVFVHDVTRERKAEIVVRELRNQLFENTPFDPLTGLANVGRFHEELFREHGRSARAWDCYSVLRLGIAATPHEGDESDELDVPPSDGLISRVAQALKPCVRAYDVLALLHRGDFGVLLPGADRTAAIAVGERLATGILIQSFDLPPGYCVHVAVGGAIWRPPSDATATVVAERAASALREARREGSGAVHIVGE
jgi:diguanylate cyclase (GGDEF)-like protein